MVFDTPAMDDCDGALERDIAYILSASPFDKRLGYVIPILAQSSRERFYKYYERIACYLGSLRNSRNSFLNSFQGHNDERTARAWGLLHTSVKFLLQANRRLVCVCVPGNYPPTKSLWAKSPNIQPRISSKANASKKLLA